MAKQNQQNNNVPEWAAFFTRKQYQKFLSLIDDFFKTKNVPYCRLENKINVADEFFDGIITNGTITLVKVATRCYNSHPGVWKKIIADYFERIIQATLFEKQLVQNAGNFSFFRPYLSARILESNGLPDESHLIAYLYDNLYAEIIFDFPVYIRRVQKSEIINWGKTAPEIVDIAIEQFVAKQNSFPFNSSGGPAAINN